MAGCLHTHMRLFQSVLFFAMSSTAGAGTCNIVGDKAYGDCGNVTINKKAPENKTIKGTETLSGIHSNVRVLSGGRLYLSGIADTISIEKGGYAEISGVTEAVINKGGTVKVTGITGRIDAQAGSTELTGQVSYVSGRNGFKAQKNSVIGGQPQ